MIMTAVICLVILAVGVFAFFVTITSVPTVSTPCTTMMGNITATGNSVFNIVGIILIIGAIMTIVGLVYSFARPGAY